MKRTKDGGAILEHGGRCSKNSKNIRLTKEEFERSRAIRDLMRIGLVFAVGTANWFFNYYIYEDWGFTIAVILLMIGWRLKAGW